MFIFLGGYEVLLTAFTMVQFAWGVVARVLAQHVLKLQKELGGDDPRVSEAKQDLADIVTPIRILCGVFPILGTLHSLLSLPSDPLIQTNLIPEFQLERLRVYEIPIPGG